VHNMDHRHIVPHLVHLGGSGYMDLKLLSNE